MRPASPFAATGRERPGVRVRTLVALRWIAIAGQLAAIGVVAFWFGFPMRLTPTLAAVAASVALNLGLLTLHSRTARLEGGAALAHLAFDLVQLGVLLFLTGGLANPFVMLMLVPVTIGATLLSTEATAALVGLAVVILLALWSLALPLPWGDPPMTLPAAYKLGVLTAVTSGMVFLGIYAGRVSAEARRRALALVATEAALEREAKMSALGSLAAAAAHELGGPLGTITLVAHDLEEALGNDPDFGADVRLLGQEAERSRAILAGIARRAEAEEPFARVPVAALLHEVAAPHEGGAIDFGIEAPTARDIGRSPELLHALANIVANAARHARTRVDLIATATDRELKLSVRDDGAGFPADLLPELGEPFLGPSRSGAGGTGLGIFIATTLLERTGARLTFRNRAEGGAEVDIAWPRAHIDSA